MKKILMSIISLAFMALSTSAMAATANSTLNVSATGVITCTSTSTPISFGNYDGRGATGLGSAGASCNAAGVPVVISLNGGAHFDVATSTRRLANGTNFLNYEIYGNVSRSSIFGDGTHGVPFSMTTNTIGHGANHAAYGIILAGQNVAVGAYTDIVDVTVTY